MAAALPPGVHQFQNIFLGTKGAMVPGQLRVHPEGFVWRKLGGGKTVELSKADVSTLTWVKLPTGFQLSVRHRTGNKTKFLGFRPDDVNSLSPILSGTLGLPPKQQELAISGQNWGEALIDGNMLSFSVGKKQAFEVSIADVSQTQMQGKNDVMLQFHVDDTTGEKDSLLEMSFHVPTTNTHYVGTEGRPAAQVFQEQVLAKADVGPSGDESVIEFDQCNVLIPRGRFRIDLHISHLRLQGLAGDFKIQYKVVSHIYVLPKANQPHTFVVVTLDTPIRKGNTSYHHVVVQFPNEEEFEDSLSIDPELLKTKYKDRLQQEYKGLIHESFADILKGLSGAKIISHGSFKSHNKGYSVRTSLKAEEGYLYPLEKAFFFLPKPPTLIPYEEIEYVAFERHGAGQSSLSSSYFDVVVKLKTDQEHQFRNVQRSEYGNLFDFFRNKKLKILNLGEKGGPSATAAAMAELAEHDDDPFLNRARAEGNAAGGGAEDSDSEEDEDFVAKEDDGGSPTDSSGGSGEDDDSDEEEGGGGGGKRRGGDDEDEDEDEDEEEQRPQKAKPLAKSSSGKRKAGEENGGGGPEKEKKKRKKKDPDAPKRALSGFMYFSQAERENVKRDNPGIAFTEIGKILGERWKGLSAEEKEPYERKAREDKVRYTDAMKTYKDGASTKAAKGEEDEDEDEDED